MENNSTTLEYKETMEERKKIGFRIFFESKVVVQQSWTAKLNSKTEQQNWKVKLKSEIS